MEQKKKEEMEKVSELEAKVTGIGGIFFFSEDPQKIKEWYAKNLGIQVDEWGATFASRNVQNPDEINYLQWSPFKQGSDYFDPSQKAFMINYRVQNIEKLVEDLRRKGVQILDDIETYSYGKFVHILDEERNKIELWEPIDSGFTEMNGSEEG